MKSRQLRGAVVLAAITCSLALTGGAFAAGDANRSSCPPQTEVSPGFRTYSSDCRAYEMVTPPYKGGAEVQLLLKAISVDGSQLIGTGFGGFAGIENNEQGRPTFGAGVYKFSRSQSRWLVEPLQPPATQVSHSSYVDASADLSHTLWELIEEPQQPTDESPPEKELLNSSTRYGLAIRTAGNDSPARFAAVGPENPSSEALDERNFTFQGASSDLSHILFGIEAKGNDIWPGDTTEQGEEFESLYEYSGLGNSEPLLVGVENVGKLKGEPHVNEGAELISNCGTVLGSPFASKYNAVSNSGETVFFTALACGTAPSVNTLYARINQEHTVAISQPVHPISSEQGNGSAPQECDSTCQGASQAPAVFQGASEDGSRVFFTTTQSLLNEDEGGEGSGNDLYEDEFRNGNLIGVRQVSHDPSGAANVLGVVRVAAQGSRVYFVAEGVLTGANAEGTAPIEGQDNLYVYEAARETTKFVAALSPSDSSDWSRADNKRSAQTTPSGRFLVFPSVEKLTGAEDTSTVTQLFEYDAETERIVRASIGQQSSTGYFCSEHGRLESGYNCNGNTANGNLVPVMQLPSYFQTDSPTEAGSKLSVTSDGRVFFMSLDALAPSAVEGSKNIYEYSHEDLYLIAAGENPQLEFAAFQESFNEHDRLVSTDESGSDLFFGAVGQLVPQDTDSQTDVYDARTNGGFPGVLVADGCEGELCRGAGSVAPALLTPSVTLPGENFSGPTKTQATTRSRAKSLTSAQKLANALRACRKKIREKRRGCEARARKRFKPRPAKKSNGRSK